MNAEQIVLAFDKKITIKSKPMKGSDFKKMLAELKSHREHNQVH